MVLPTSGFEDETVFLTDCEVDGAAKYSLLHNVPPEWVNIPEDSLWDEHEELIFAFSPTNVNPFGDSM